MEPHNSLTKCITEIKIKAYFIRVEFWARNKHWNMLKQFHSFPIFVLPHVGSNGWRDLSRFLGHSKILKKCPTILMMVRPHAITGNFIICMLWEIIKWLILNGWVTFKAIVNYSTNIHQWPLYISITAPLHMCVDWQPFSIVLRQRNCFKISDFVNEWERNWRAGKVKKWNWDC